ncbi:Hypothetical predicted protein [Lecanosticta acicola]|uniref:BTB domain-containing protein n=1 Tax=Lecanosticta acicola TaxID=111012 RepID=A0AAI9EDI8_9PEZI|nr:Hypothetical predicted protein [Lecanosticta acicola]
MTADPPASTPMVEHPWDPYGHAILVHVGQGAHETLFKVEASAMRYYSGYFKMVTSEPSFTGILRLPGESPEIFAMAYQYLTLRTFFPHSAPTQSFDRLIDLYAFGVRRNMPLIQNTAADLFATKIKQEKVLPDRWAIEYLWEQTSPGALLRQEFVVLVREMWLSDRGSYQHSVWNELVGGKSEDPERLCWVAEEFVRAGLSVRVSAKTTRRLQACEWHVHEKGEYCEGSEEARLWHGGPIGRVEEQLRVRKRSRSRSRSPEEMDLGGSFRSG